MSSPESRPTFRLSSLLYLMGFICAFLAIMTTLGPLPSFAFLLAFLAIFAHVSGNAMGTHLRDNAGIRDEDGTGHEMRVEVTADEFAPTTQLSEQIPLGRSIIATTLIGSTIGGLSGCILFLYLYWGQISLISVLVGAFAFAFLGGFFSFVAGSFIQTSAQAAREAAGHDQYRVEHEKENV